MAYVIALPCVDVMDRACVEVCPVDCIYEADAPDKPSVGSGPKFTIPDGLSTENVSLLKRMLVIHPEECIDCGACEPECPVQAIFAEDDVPEEWHEFIALNAQAFGL